VVLAARAERAWLIRQARCYPDPTPLDVRLAGGLIAAMGTLAPLAGEQVIDAKGACLLPGLVDHHIHLRALAAKAASVSCGPPDVEHREALINALKLAPGTDWIRGVGYHESVAGNLTCKNLDQLESSRPVRIQHRSGRLWILNSKAIDRLRKTQATLDALPALEIASDGRLFDQDQALGLTLRASLQGGLDHDAIEQVSAELASYGITGIHDMTPSNGPEDFAYFSTLLEQGKLYQSLCLSGLESVQTQHATSLIRPGCFKVHLHEHQLPTFDATVSRVAAAHAFDLPVAIHCVTRAELVFALSVLEAAGTHAGDRIEHGAIIEPDLEAWLVDLGPGIVTQPHFILDRGDQYLQDIPAEEQASLYRFKTLKTLGLRVALGSDAPFGAADPWRAMRAAVARTSTRGHAIGPDECVSPEEALEGFLGEFRTPFTPRSLTVGIPADLVLLSKPWAEARHRLLADDVRMTWHQGQVSYRLAV